MGKMVLQPSHEELHNNNCTGRAEWRCCHNHLQEEDDSNNEAAASNSGDAATTRRNRAIDVNGDEPGGKMKEMEMF